uniref:Sigma c capsid protein n=1 Tax=Avian orthoreovirus TaxID=38170 RepID=A0A8D5Q4W0_9REOV|nr:sigma c capsid protein [Avian orthoreovirus]
MAGLTPSQRREVVGLILSLTSNTSISPGDLTPIYDRLSAVETACATLNDSVGHLASTTSDLSTRLDDLVNVSRDIATDLKNIRSRVSALQVSIDSVSNDVSTLSQTLSTHDSQLSTLSSSVGALSTNMSNLQHDVTASALNISDLQRRVAALESSSGSSFTFLAPLRVDGGSVSLDMDPYFCSERANLTSYSASAQLLQFQWFVRSEGGSSDSIDMSVVAHCHGRRTDYLMSSHDSLTVTGNSVSLVFNLDYITTPGVDYARLIPCHGFQQATFPVDISFTKNDTTHTYQVYGAFDGPRVFKVTFSPGETSTTNVRFLTVRTGIDT